MSVTQTHDAILSPRRAGEGQLSSITSKLLGALLFEILVVLANIYGVLVMVGTTIAMATEDHFTGVTLYFGYLTDLAGVVFLAAAAVITLLVARRTWMMLNAVNREDVAALQNLSSLGWAVIAVIFSAILPGLVLLRVNRSIRGLSA